MADRHRDRDRDRDRGVTLPELLVTVVILGVVTGAITAAFIVILRSLPDTEARADDARTLTGLTTYLPEDVASTPPDGFLFDDPAHLTLCVGDSPGVGLLRLGWSNHLRSWVVDYRLVADADGRTRVRRYACEPGGEPSVANLTSPLDPIDEATWQPGDPPVVVEPVLDDLGRVVGVRVTVTSADGTSATMVATSNNPAEALAAVSTTSVRVATTTTSSTTSTTSTSTTSTTSTLPDESTTTVADESTTSTTTSTTTTSTTTTLPPCEVSSLVASPASVTNNRGSSSRSMATLRDAVDVSVTASGSCTDLVLEFDPDLFDGTYDPQWLSFGPGNATGTTTGVVTIAGQPAGVPWSDGSHTLTIRNGIGSVALATVELVVT